MSTRGLAASVAAGAVLVDQLTKIWVVAAIDGQVTLIDGFLRLRVTRNTGAAFSSLQGLGPAIGLAAVGVIGLVWVMIHRAPRLWEVVGLGLVLGGALGNLLDRIFRGDGVLNGGVVDWIDFSFFPSFNGADSAITIGVAILLLGALRPIQDA